LYHITSRAAAAALRTKEEEAEEPAAVAAEKLARFRINILFAVVTPLRHTLHKGAHKKHEE